MNESSRSHALLARETSRLLIVDVQEKLITAIPTGRELAARCRLLWDGAALLEVPRDATEQYPKGLGPTAAELAAVVGTPPQKLRFSAAESLSWSTRSAGDERRQVLLAGLETHICILQTALDLMARGFEVHLAVDAVGSRHQVDHDVALNRLSSEGATLTTVEMALFEWCETAESPEFKDLSRLVTGR